VCCVLDDFGTGYSSLSYLHRLPLVALKIDRSFILNIGDDQGGAIVRTITALGQALGLAVLAEGVETAGQHAFIAAAGCHGYQGYLYGRPMPAAQLAEFIAHAGGQAPG
jgi:EAL domain-containing protein (putative c-di-GMP-specific phosphodiesterase class I)